METHVDPDTPRNRDEVGRVQTRKHCSIAFRPECRTCFPTVGSARRSIWIYTVLCVDSCVPVDRETSQNTRVTRLWLGKRANQVVSRIVARYIWQRLKALALGIHPEPAEEYCIARPTRRHLAMVVYLGRHYELTAPKNLDSKNEPMATDSSPPTPPASNAFHLKTTFFTFIPQYAV